MKLGMCGKYVLGIGLACVWAVAWVLDWVGVVDYMMLIGLWTGVLLSLFRLTSRRLGMLLAIGFNAITCFVILLNEIVRRYVAGGLSVELVQLCSLDGLPALLRFNGKLLIGVFVLIGIAAWGFSVIGEMLARRIQLDTSKRLMYWTGGFFLLGMMVVLTGRMMPTMRVCDIFFADIKTLSPQYMHKYGVKFPVLEYSDIQVEPGMNLVHIFLESTEAGFLDERRFPGLTPHLNQLKQMGRSYSHVEVAENARLTFGGIFASQCGYFQTPQHLRFGDHECDLNIGYRLPTLPGILHRGGYRQSFIYGHQSSFSAFESYLKRENFKVIQLHSEQERSAGGNLSYAGSCCDGEVLERAWVEFKKLADGGTPFHLSVLTLDAHAPNGICPPEKQNYRKGAPTLLHAIFNTDMAVGEFAARIRSHPAGKKTVLVIQCDHPQHPYAEASVMARLEADSARPLLFLIVGAPGLIGVNDRKGMTFDIAPTILCALKVKHNASFLLGENLENKCNPKRLLNCPEQVSALSTAVAFYSLALSLPQDNAAR